MSIRTSDVSPICADTDGLNESSFAKRHCCCCFPFLNAKSSPSDGGYSHISSAAPDASVAGDGERWWRRGWKKMREWSEIIAGPKWKTLIRRIGKRRGRQWNGKFHYDPMSYTLNFDDGPGQNGHYDEDLLGRGFSSRFSLPPVSAKSSLDFDSDGAVFHVTST